MEAECNATFIIQQLLKQIDTHINSSALIKLLPQYLSKNILKITSECVLNYQFQAKRINQRLMEQNVERIPKLRKDTLMPKDPLFEIAYSIKEKSNALEQNVSNSAYRVQSKIRTANLKNVDSTMAKSIRKNVSQSQSKKDGQTPLLLQIKNNEDPQIVRIKQKTQKRYQLQCGQKKTRQEKIKRLNERRSEFNSSVQESNFTFDYEGESFKTIQQDGKIQFYTMRSNLGRITKRMKQDYVVSKEQKQQIEFKRQKQSSMRKEEKAIKQALIPVFKQEKNKQIANTLNLAEYRKAFGNKYNRINTRNQSIQMKTIDVLPQIMLQSAHLRDEFSLKQSKVSQFNHQIRRKLPLPKLNGKYKVLDRYNNC